MSRRRDAAPIRIEDALLLGAVCLLPWFWGGVEMAAYRSASALLVSAAAIVVWNGGARALLPRETKWIWIPAVLLGTWGALQSVPLPRSVVTVLSPKAAEIQREAYGGAGPTATTWLRSLEERARTAVPEAADAAAPKEAARPGPDAPAPPRRFTLSLLPAATAERTFWYFALLAGFLVVYRRAGTGGVGEAYETALFATFALLAVTGLLHRATAPQTLLWIRPAPEMSRPFGPYVNPDHFAGVMEIGVPWMFGWSVSRLTSRRSWKANDPKLVLAIGGTVFGLVSAIVAASKIATLLIGLSSLVVLRLAARGARAARIRFAVAIAGVAAVVGLATYGFLGQRIAEFVDVSAGRFGANDRLLVWRIGARMFGDYWLCGSGIGAFRVVFPAYMPAGESGIWAQAHSDWLELALGGGIVAVGVAAWVILGYSRAAWRSWGAAAAGPRRGAVLGAVLGVGSLSAHALVDFNHQIPANALLFVATAAWVAAAGAREGLS